MKFIRKFLKSNWQILLVLLIAAVLRFWQWENSVIFSLEENNILYTLEKFVIGNWSPLLGQEATGYVHHLFHSPWYIYVFSIVFRIFNGEPLVFSFIHTTIGVLSVLIWYLIGRKIKNKKFGIIAAFLVAISYRFIFIDHTAWAVGLVPFATTLALYLLVNKKLWLLGCWLAFALSLHYQMVILIMGILAWSIYKYKRKTLFVLIPIALSLIPLIIFDLRHNFFNLYGFYLTGTTILSGQSPYSSGHFLYFTYPFVILIFALMLSKLNIKLCITVISIYVVTQLNTFVSKAPEKSYPLKNQLVEELLNKYDGKEIKVLFSTPDSFEYKYLLFLRAGQRGINISDIHIYERWQPHEDAMYTIENNEIITK